MKKNQNKTTGVVFNTWLSRFQNKCPILFSNNISLQKNKKIFQILSLPSNFSSLLLNEKKNLLLNYKVQGLLCTTIKALPSEKNFPFFNRSFDKKRLKMLFSWYYANRGEAATFSLIEKVQKLGFTYAMKAGISLGVDDLKVPPTKGESLTEAVELLGNTKASVKSGNVTALEEFQQFVDTWHRTSENLKTSVVQNFSRSTFSFFNLSNSKSSLNSSQERENQFLLRETNKGSNLKEDFSKQKQKSLASYSTILNPVYMMAFSGARGNLSQVRQLVGMRGLMADPQGQLVEFPIQSNFREGLTVTEYMISCYGARKGLVDTALRTAAAGYLTRRLVDVSHHQIVRFVTCGTKSGILLSNEHNKKEQSKDNLLPSAWKVPPNFPQKINKLLHKTKEENEKKAPLVFCVGRVLARDIPGYAFRNQEIDISLASSPLLRKVYDTIGIYIRSPLTCKAETGICQLCYGWSVSANRLVGLGEAVGIIAAQSIGEPGTQLTMRTFHTGGVFSGDIMEECRAKHAGVVVFQNVYLGLLVRTAGGAIAFCLKTSAVFQIKGASEITTYNVSANTLLFVRQGEKVIMDSLLAQIPNLPTVEESTGESTKTIVSDLSGEVRQKATVNPELASIRILAGQECKQFYLSNSFSMFTVQNKQNKYSTTPMYLQKKLICTNSLNTKKRAQIKNNKYLVQHDYSHALNWDYQNWPSEHSTSILTSKKKKGLVNLIWGAHRLGNNQTFSININGSNSEVILLDQRERAAQMKLSPSLQQSLLYLSNGLNTNFTYSTGLEKSADQITQTIETSNYWAQRTKKIALLVDLRFFVASKMHQNKFATAFLKKNSGTFAFSNNFTTLSKIKLGMTSKATKIKKLSPALLVPFSKKSKSQNSGLFQLVIYKINSCKQGYPTIKTKPNLTLTNSFLYYGKTWQKQAKVINKFYATHYYHAELLKLKDFFMVCKTSKLIPFKWSFLARKVKPDTTKQFYKNTLKAIQKKNTESAIKKISSFTVWPELISPNMFDYAYLFWKLEDLVFFRSNFTEKAKTLSQLQVSINQHWWGNTSANYFLCKPLIIKKSKGLELIDFLKESQKTSFIKEFPGLILKLFSRFNIENSINNFPLSSHKIQELSYTSAIASSNVYSKKNLTKPRLKFQDSGEIFPLQGNTNLKEFQKKFYSFQNVTKINSGLLIHSNRISYKIPLCSAYKKVSSSVQTNNSISTKEQLSLLRSELAKFTKQSFIEQNNPLDWLTRRATVSSTGQSQLWEKEYKQDLQNSQSKLSFSMYDREVIVKRRLVPQIGEFLNTGDEILNEYASAYCGQIIEKSPMGLTLRLTQNILYSNLRNRPAKINKSVKNGNWIRKGAPLVTLPYISNVTGDIVAGIPKIEQLFEARGEALDETVEKIWNSIKLSIVPRSKAVRECFKEIGLFVVAAIQKVYSSQGVHIADKHLEVIIRQMTRRALIVDPGDTEFLPEEFVDLNTIECVNWATYGDNAIYRPRLIGITKASLTSNSFLSSASFQQTARVLERETVLEKTDRLLGLKERVMMGALINAGTGELKTSVRLSDRSLGKSLSSKLFQRLSFFSRRKIEINKKINS